MESHIFTRTCQVRHLKRDDEQLELDRVNVLHEWHRAVVAQGNTPLGVPGTNVLQPKRGLTEGNTHLIIVSGWVRKTTADESCRESEPGT